MPALLSSLVDNLSEIYKKECKKCKKREAISECRFIGTEDNKLSYKCKKYNDKSYILINASDKQFSNTHKFRNNDPNKFALLLRKGIYPYENMDSWKMRLQYHQK